MNLIKKDKDSLIKYRIERSKEAIKDAFDEISNCNFFGAVNRIYYSMFYIISALALRKDFSTSKHVQLIGWFNKTFIHTGIIDSKFAATLKSAFNNRLKGDYGDFVEFSKEQVESMFTDMQEFVNEIEKLIKE